MSLADAVKRLGDPDPSVRDAAAKTIRDAMEKDPRACGDPGEKLAFIESGISVEQFEEETGGKCESGISSGGSTTVIFRLDDYWIVEAFFAHDMVVTRSTSEDSDWLHEIGRLSRSVRSVWVEPPTKTFTGRWVTYYVNGVVASELEYAAGEYHRVRAYHDNAQLMHEQVYVDGEIDGPEIGWHKDGTKAYEIRYAAGKSVGKWTYWYPSGKVQSEQTYADGALDGPWFNFREDGTKSLRVDYQAGKETGQAGWDEQGRLVFARGTASDAK
jgi:hypothetical protein